MTKQERRCSLQLRLRLSQTQRNDALRCCRGR